MTTSDPMEPAPPSTPRQAVEVVRSKEQASVRTVWAPSRTARIVKRVVTERRTFAVDLQREELAVEYAPYDGGEGAAGEPQPQGPIEMILREEQLVVDRRVVPVERVVVSVQRVDGTAEVGADVSREEVRVERTGR